VKTPTMGICLEILTYQVGTWAWTHFIGVMPVVKGQRPSPLGRPGILNNTLVIIYRLKKLTSIVPKLPKNIMVVSKSHRHDTLIPQCFICYYPPTIILKYVFLPHTYFSRIKNRTTNTTLPLSTSHIFNRTTNTTLPLFTSHIFQ
jgi:hypothetical protein